MDAHVSLMVLQCVGKYDAWIKEQWQRSALQTFNGQDAGVGDVPKFTSPSPSIRRRSLVYLLLHCFFCLLSGFLGRKWGV